MKIKTALKLLAILFLVTDAAVSFQKYYTTTLDGDMARLLVPDGAFEPVLQDPFATHAFFQHQICNSPNRYFAIETQRKLFEWLPEFFRPFMNPVDAVYATCATIKIFVQVLIIFLLSAFATRSIKITSSEFLFCASIITSLIQTKGYYENMEVINVSVTYTIFYALPLALLLLYFLPFQLKKNFLKNSVTLQLLWCMLAVFISLNGPLAPAITLVVVPVYFVADMLLFFNSKFRRNLSLNQTVFWFSQKDKTSFFHFTFLFLCAGYSIIAGQFNSEAMVSSIPLRQRYVNEFNHLGEYVFTKAGLPMMIIAVILCSILLVRAKHFLSFKKVLIFVLCFDVLYILLLPMGGYRIYRPNIIGHDVMMPVTLSFMFLIARVVLLLAQSSTRIFQKTGLAIAMLIILIFTLNDTHMYNNNESERLFLIRLSHQPISPVAWPMNTYIAGWDFMYDENLSRLNAEMFEKFKIVNQPILFYQTQP